MTDRPPASGVGIAGLVRRLLDGEYDAAMSTTLAAIAASLVGGVLRQRFDELDTEAQRLADEGTRFSPTNAVLTALLFDLSQTMQANAQRVQAAAEAAQALGVDAAGRLVPRLSLGATDDAAIARLGIAWNRPDPQAIRQAVQYVNNAAWGAEIARYPQAVIDAVRAQVVQGITEGWGPIRTAREIRQVAQSLSAAQANNLLRTVQLQSYREATRLNQLANADIGTEVIRIAALDARTCLSCIALHGTRYPVGTRIDDHHQGRCTGVMEVRGRPIAVQSGETWWAGLSEERRRQQAGPANFNAMAAGRATLRDFSGEYMDPVFGRMTRERSLVEVLGADASQFYARNQGR